MDFLRALHEAGADFNITNKKGQSVAFLRFHDAEAISFLGSLGVRFDVPAVNGETARDVAIRESEKDTNAYPALEKAIRAMSESDRRNSTLPGGIPVKEQVKRPEDVPGTSKMSRVRAAARRMFQEKQQDRSHVRKSGHQR